MSKKISEELKTISGITVTPFDGETGEIDWQGVEENVEFLIENGLKVIVPCGNTSEFYALTIEEAMEETKRTVEIARGRCLVVAGIGYSVGTAIEMGQKAKADGADAIMIHMPVHPYITSEGAKDYFEEIIRAVDLPAVIYFKNPSVSDDILVELADLEQLVGVKYAINDLPRFAKALESLPQDAGVTMICGTAEKWAPFYYSAGAEGFTSGLVNVHPKKSFELLDALQQQDYSTAFGIWHEIVEFEDLREKYSSGNNVVVIKEAMEILNMTAGPPRPPVAPLNDADREAVSQLLSRWALKSY
ncbi:dihydrodipicolinate synthase family protein [Salinicoccus sp. ID82-1]|uniref:dihydrodipicolinate synthase family protein n=1 Tax=Salinicoccus sp. ID82-1 TaxID=2820269 RepID=UPI001F26A275|nr:dihydrodipicolinate synthase family protein [Salinicoccus sp. ID82-1]MCG1009735.1 dihydrodipicolinate synthase family protein [Salinicoccus sp. ID82-1]